MCFNITSICREKSGDFAKSIVSFTRVLLLSSYSAGSICGASGLLPIRNAGNSWAGIKHPLHRKEETEGKCAQCNAAIARPIPHNNGAPEHHIQYSKIPHRQFVWGGRVNKFKKVRAIPRPVAAPIATSSTNTH